MNIIPNPMSAAMYITFFILPSTFGEAVPLDGGTALCLSEIDLA
jgi:hypothetical protein